MIYLFSMLLYSPYSRGSSFKGNFYSHFDLSIVSHGRGNPICSIIISIASRLVITVNYLLQPEIAPEVLDLIWYQQFIIKHLIAIYQPKLYRVNVEGTMSN